MRMRKDDALPTTGVETQTPLVRLLTTHQLVMKQEDTAVVNTTQLDPRQLIMPDGRDSGRWSLADNVISDTSLVSADLPPNGWKLYSPGIGGMPGPDGKFVYNATNGGTPPAFCQNVLLQAEGKLHMAMMAAATAVGRSLAPKSEVVHMFAAMGIMRQLSVGWRYPTQKLKEFLLAIPDLDWNPNLPHPKPQAILHYVKTFVMPDEKFIVFCRYRGGIMDISETLKADGIKVVSFDGKTPKQDRPALLKKAKKDPSVRGLVCSHIADSGLNLQEFNHTIFASNWWHSKYDEQAVHRQLRMGQTKSVYVTWFTVGNKKASTYQAIEQMMVERCMTKQKDGNEVEAISRLFAAAASSSLAAPPVHLQVVDQPLPSGIPVLPQKRKRSASPIIITDDDEDEERSPLSDYDSSSPSDSEDSSSSYSGSSSSDESGSDSDSSSSSSSSSSSDTEPEEAAVERPTKRRKLPFPAPIPREPTRPERGISYV
jgi:hypothetical protein